MKIAVFWVVAPCSLVEVYRRFVISLMMEAANTSGTSESFYRLHGATTQKTSIFSDQVGHKHLTLECFARDSSVKNSGLYSQDPFDVLNDQ
jgi:hypothetical protein